jgi:hypothetical protein
MKHIDKIVQVTAKKPKKIPKLWSMHQIANGERIFKNLKIKPLVTKDNKINKILFIIHIFPFWVIHSN